MIVEFHYKVKNFRGCLFYFGGDLSDFGAHLQALYQERVLNVGNWNLKKQCNVYKYEWLKFQDNLQFLTS